MTSPSGAVGTRHAYVGVACVLIATIGFSGKAVIVKLAYQYPVDVMTLLELLMAVFSTVLPLWLMAEALRRIGADQAALVACIGPISTFVFARIFLGEPISAVQLLGAVLVLAGVMIISVKPQAASGDRSPQRRGL